MLFQKLCSCKCDRDKSIPDELLEIWNGLIADLELATVIYLPRIYASGLDSPAESATLFFVSAMRLLKHVLPLFTSL